VEPLMCCIH